jgi:phosphonate transport system substrate-binding protein
LSPKLGERIKTAFLEFDWQGTGLHEQFQAQGVEKFVPVAYKQDFALIRRLDDAFRKPLSTTAN